MIDTIRTIEGGGGGGGVQDQKSWKQIRPITGIC